MSATVRLLVVVGAATLLSAVPAALGDRALPVFWLVATPVVVLLLRRELRTRALLVALAALVPFPAGALGATVSTADAAMGVALVAVGAALRDRPTVVAGALTGSAQLALTLAGANDEPAPAAALTGLALLTAPIWGRRA